MSRLFRFGVVLTAVGSRRAWVEKCRRAEALGYDVLLVPDHIGNPAPFVSVLLAAEATERPRVGTFVLNAAFYNPVLLARDAFATDQFTDGRLELGIGTGYARAQFEQAGIPFESAGRRVDHLERAIAELSRLAADPTFAPSPAQRPGPPLLVAGHGDRVLRLAATHAATVALAGARPVPGDPPLALVDAETMEERVRFVRGAAGDRDVELNIAVQEVVVTDDRRGAAERFTRLSAGLTVDQRLEIPTFLAGTAGQIAEQLEERRERFGFTYVTVREAAMGAFAPVVEMVR